MLARMVLRYDRAELTRPQKLPNGMLRVDARIAKANDVLVYRNASGQERREYVPPDALFHADHLDSLRLAPLTLGHPQPPGPLTAQNAATYMRGAVEAPRADGRYLTASLLVTHADAVEAIESGRMREISEGYHVELDETPGVTPDGQRYDAIQKVRRTNHVALVPAGRAGPDVSIRMDADDYVLVDVIPSTPGDLRQDAKEPTVSMKTFKIDGVDFQAPEQTAQAFEAALAKRDQQIDKLRTDAEEATKAKSTLEAERDDLKDKLEKAEKLRADAAAPESIQKAVNARLDLVQKAAKVVKDFKADGADGKPKSDDAIKAEVIKAVYPKADLDGKDPAYLAARFDSAVEAFEEAPTPELIAARGAINGAGVRADGADDPEEAARKKMVEEQNKLWQQDPAAN